MSYIYSGESEQRYINLKQVPIKKKINDFTFKQFVIKQQRAAMRVNTDGVLLGAWANIDRATHILDIGTGTGTIALMMAQRNEAAQVKAIELDYPSFQDANENIAESVFSERVTAIHGDIQSYADGRKEVFDHIITNPPYFTNGTVSPNEQKAKARHVDALSYSDLIMSCIKLIEHGAKLSLILPTEEMEVFHKLTVNEGFYLERRCQVFKKPNVKGRVLATYVFGVATVASPEEGLLIRESNGDYSPGYKELTKNFYLNY